MLPSTHVIGPVEMLLMASPVFTYYYITKFSTHSKVLFKNIFYTIIKQHAKLSLSEKQIV